VDFSVTLPLHHQIVSQDETNFKAFRFLSGFKPHRVAASPLNNMEMKRLLTIHEDAVRCATFTNHEALNETRNTT
jgi:hypothetical protein